MNPILNREVSVGDLRWSSQLAILWLLQTVNYAAFILITQVESGMFGTLEPGSSGWGIAIAFFLPCLLAWLAFTSRVAISRWAHVVIGVLFCLIKAAATILGAVDGASFSVIFNEAWGLIAAGLIVWYAWKPPKTTE